MEQIIETTYGQVSLHHQVCGKCGKCEAGSAWTAAQALPCPAPCGNNSPLTSYNHIHTSLLSPTLVLESHLCPLQVDVTPTLWMPYANPTNNPFIYSDGPTHQFLINQGINETTDYRIIMVRG